MNQAQTVVKRQSFNPRAYQSIQLRALVGGWLGVLLLIGRGPLLTGRNGPLEFRKLTQNLKSRHALESVLHLVRRSALASGLIGLTQKQRENAAAKIRRLACQQLFEPMGLALKNGAFLAGVQCFFAQARTGIAHQNEQRLACSIIP